jgi:hypothetical protein
MYQKEAYEPIYVEGNQRFHTGVLLDDIISFIALHQEVQEKCVIICNVIDDCLTGNGQIRIGKVSGGDE